MDGRVVTLPRGTEEHETVPIEHRRGFEHYARRHGVTFSRFWVGRLDATATGHATRSCRNQRPITEWVYWAVCMAARELRVLRLYESGWGLREIGAEVGLSHELVRRLLLEHGVELRPRGGPQSRP